MTKGWYFHVRGEPVAQGRGRSFGFAKAGGKIGVRVYDPAKSRKWKEYVAKTMRQHIGTDKPLEGPVRVSLGFFFSCPKSAKKEVRENGGQHTKRPDLDNLVKAIKDAAKGIAWKDDSQVCFLQATKEILKFGHEPFVSVSIQQELEPRHAF